MWFRCGTPALEAIQLVSSGAFLLREGPQRQQNDDVAPQQDPAALPGGGGGGDSVAPLSDAELYGSFYKAQDAEKAAREAEERRQQQQEAANNDSPLVAGMRENLATVKKAMVATRSKASVVETENAALEQTKSLLTSVVTELKENLRDVHVERETGLIGEALQEQTRQIQVGQQRKARLEEDAVRIADNIATTKAEIAKIEAEVLRLKQEDEREYERTDNQLVELSTTSPGRQHGAAAADGGDGGNSAGGSAAVAYDDDTSAEEPNDPQYELKRERADLAEKNIALTTELAELQTTLGRRDAIAIEVEKRQRTLDTTQRVTQEQRDEIIAKKSETLTPLMGSFQDALVALETNYTTSVEKRIEDEWAVEAAARDSAGGDAESQEEAQLELLGKRETQQQELHEEIAKITQQLETIADDNQLLVDENTALREVHESIANDRLKLEGMMTRMTTQLSHLTAQAATERRNRTTHVQARISSLENGFSQMIITQHEEVEKLRAAVAMMTKTVQMAHTATAQSPKLRRSITLDL